MDDPLLRAAHGKATDPELARVAGHRFDLLRGDRLGRLVVRRNVVVHGREGQLGPAHGPPREPEALKGLRARHLVDEMEVDVEEVGLARRAPHDVPLPDLLRQRAPHGSSMGGRGREKLFGGEAVRAK